MKAIVLFFAIAALVTGLIAARYWYQSSKVKIKHTEADAKTFEMATFGWTVGAQEYIEKAAALNAKAAGWTAVSVSLSAVSTILGTWCSN